MSIHLFTQNHNPICQPSELCHPKAPAYKTPIPEPLPRPRIGQLAANRVITVQHNPPDSSNPISPFYVSKLNTLMLTQVKKQLLPEDRRGEVHSFKELANYLGANMYDLNEDQLSSLDAHLSNFKITKHDLYKALKGSSLYESLTTQYRVKNEVNHRSIKPFVKHLKRTIQDAYFCKRVEMHLFTLGQNELNQVTEKGLFEFCKKYPDYFHTDFISDQKIKNMIKELLAFHKRKMAKAIIRLIIEELKTYLSKISERSLSQLTPNSLSRHYNRTYSSILELVSRKSYDHFKKQVVDSLRLEKIKRSKPPKSPEEFKSPPSFLS